MTRYLTIALLATGFSCAAAPAPPDASESCSEALGTTRGDGPRLVANVHALYGAESLCRASGAGRLVRLTLGAPFTYDIATSEPSVRVEFDPEDQSGAVRWGAYRLRDRAPFPQMGFGVLQLSPARIAALRQIVATLEAAIDSTECLHCQSLLIEDRRRGSVAWFSRPRSSFGRALALSELRRDVLAAYGVRAESK
jgi:hypothetical protein